MYRFICNTLTLRLAMASSIGSGTPSIDPRLSVQKSAPSTPAPPVVQTPVQKQEQLKVLVQDAIQVREQDLGRDQRLLTPDDRNFITSMALSSARADFVPSDADLGRMRGLVDSALDALNNAPLPQIEQVESDELLQEEHLALTPDVQASPLLEEADVTPANLDKFKEALSQASPESLQATRTELTGLQQRLVPFNRDDNVYASPQDLKDLSRIFGERVDFTSTDGMKSIQTLILRGINAVDEKLPPSEAVQSAPVSQQPSITPSQTPLASPSLEPMTPLETPGPRINDSERLGKRVLKLDELITTRSDSSDPLRVQTSSGELGGGALANPLHLARGQFATVSLRDIDGSGVGMTLTASHTFGKSVSYQPDGRLLQCETNQGGLGLSAMSKVLVQGVPLFGSVNLTASASVAYARVVPEDVNGLELARTSHPPTKLDIARNPETLQTGEEIAFKGQFKIGVSARVRDTVTLASLSVGINKQSEWVTSIRANGGDPPSYSVRVEPSNSTVSAKASAGWGPFSMEVSGGRSSSVHYEFEMTAAALQVFMTDGQLPALPNPNQTINPDTGAIKPEVFAHFQAQAKNTDGAEIQGIRLVNFGTANSRHVSGALQSLAASIRNTQTSSHTVDASSEDVTQHRIRETRQTSRVLLASTDATVTVDHTFKSRRQSDDSSSLTNTYEGATVTANIRTTLTKPQEFQDRLGHLNSLLDRNLQGAHDKYGTMTVTLEANATPDHIRALAALNPADPLTMKRIDDLLAKMGRHLPPSMGKSVELREAAFKQSLLALITDLRATAAPTALTSRDAARLERQQTTLDQDVLHRQGASIAAFMANGDAHMAVLDQLTGGTMVEAKAVSSTFQSTLTGIGAQGFLRAPMSTLESLRPHAHMRRFTETADKMNQLDALRTKILAFKAMEPQERQVLLRQIDESWEQLTTHMDEILANPTAREQILDRLPTSSSTFGQGQVMRAVNSLPPIRDEFGVLDNVNTRGQLMSRVYSTALVELDGSGDAQAQIGQLTGMAARLISQNDSQPIFPQLTMQVLEQAQRNGILADVITQLAERSDDNLPILVAQLPPEDRARLKEMAKNPSASALIGAAITAAEEESTRRLAEHQQMLAALEGLSDEATPGPQKREMVMVPVSEQLFRPRERTPMLRAAVQEQEPVSTPQQRTSAQLQAQRDADLTAARIANTLDAITPIEQQQPVSVDI